jgi:hypothetical protein
MELLQPLMPLDLLSLLLLCQHPDKRLHLLMMLLPPPKLLHSRFTYHSIKLFSMHPSQVPLPTPTEILKFKLPG